MRFRKLWFNRNTFEASQVRAVSRVEQDRNLRTCKLDPCPIDRTSVFGSEDKPTPSGTLKM
jgi:hypothetical protein